MATRAQIARMKQQRKATYGLIGPESGDAFVLIAQGQDGPMVGGNLTVFPFGVDGILPADAMIMTQRTVVGAGALGDTNVDTIDPGVGGSFRIHSSAATEVSSWFWWVYSAKAAE